MYDLGDQFALDLSKAKANPYSVLAGEKYRITVLTERLVRLEYSPNGVFEDRPTELVFCRNFPQVEVSVKDGQNSVVLETKYFILTYVKNAPFKGTSVNKTANLKVELKGTDRVWYYGHPEVRNYLAPILQATDSKEDDMRYNMKGLYSIDGFASIDDSRSKVFNARGNCLERENPEIDIYLFMYFRDFSLCLKDYYMLTGYPALIPRYALGNWWSRNDSYTEEKLEELITNFETNKIPMSIIMLDKDWHIRYKDGERHLKTGFTFNGELIQSPTKLVDLLHSKGIRIGLNINPIEGFYPIDAYYAEAKKYLPPLTNGVIPFNVYDAKTVDVYLKIYIHPLDNFGIDFFWIDWYDKDRTTELALLKHYHFYDMMRNYKRRPMVYGYNSSVAAHRYPVLYAGKSTVSWDTLKAIPFYNGKATNIGVSWWSHDIGGFFYGTEDNELYERYIQLGTFSPILKLSADVGRFYKREPWRWDMKTYAIAKDYLQLRHRLIPYLYSEAYKYYKYGIPLIQPIYYRYPELYDDVLYRNEYYFGSQFFICPITIKKELVMNRVIQKFFLPEGTWYDFVTGKKFPGGHKYVSFFRDQDYPVFAKAGAIIPLANHENLNDTTPPKDMEIHIFPGESNNYRLYEDDGVSDLYLKGYYLLSLIDYNYLPNNYTVIIRPLEGKSGIVPDTRNYKIRFRNTKKSTDVSAYVRDIKVECFTTVEGPDFIVEVKDVPTTQQLTINCKGKDIEIDAIRIIMEDVESIISDLPIPTKVKEQVYGLFVSDQPINKKRIAIRKMGQGKDGLETKYVQLFIKLLEYISQV